MAKHYYTATDKLNYPPMYQAVVDRVKFLIATVLYSKEPYYTSGNTLGSEERFFISNFAQGSELSIQENIKKFKTVQGNFPMTAYNLSDISPKTENRSHKQKSYTYYSDIFGCYLSSQPTEFTIDMVSFFTSAADYLQAKTMLDDVNANLTRLLVPININNFLTAFYIDLELELNKYSLAFEFSEYLRLGRIFDIQHNCKITMNTLIVKADNVYPVDNIPYSLSELESRQNAFLGLASPTPEILYTIPQHEAINVSRTADISLHFSAWMDEASVFNSLDIVPKIDYQRQYFNNSGTVLTIQPLEALSSGTTYNVSLIKDAKSINNKYLEENFLLTFTTE